MTDQEWSEVSSVMVDLWPRLCDGWNSVEQVRAFRAVLGRYQVGVAKQACRRHFESSKYPPKPGELGKLASALAPRDEPAASSWTGASRTTRELAAEALAASRQAQRESIEWVQSLPDLGLHLHSLVAADSRLAFVRHMAEQDSDAGWLMAASLVRGRLACGLGPDDEIAIGPVTHPETGVLEGWQVIDPPERRRRDETVGAAVADSVGVAVYVKQLGSNPVRSPRHDGSTGYEIKLRDRKGGDPSEWPEDLMRREYP
jgi:hypothetical protein